MRRRGLPWVAEASDVNSGGGGSICPLGDRRSFPPRGVLGALGGSAFFSRAARAGLFSTGAERARALAVAGPLEPHTVVARTAELDGGVLQNETRTTQSSGKNVKC